MNFNRMKIPVLTGIDVLDDISKTQKDIYLSAVEVGVPCLIANGIITDLNGVVFENEDFQAEYRDYAQKMKNCSAVIYARIVPELELGFKDDLHELSFVTRLYRKTEYTGTHTLKCRVVAEDLFSAASETLKFEHRMAILKSILQVARFENPRMRLELQHSMKMETFDKKTAIDFVLENAEKGQQTLIYFGDSKYIQNAKTLKDCKAFYLDPHIEFELDIEEIKTTKHIDYVSKKEILVITDILVTYLGTTVNVPYYDKKQSTNTGLLKLIEEKKVTKLTFRAVPIDGTIKYCIA